jgi:hypothetical protein
MKMKGSRKLQVLAVITVAALATIAALGRSSTAFEQGEALTDIAAHGWEYKSLPHYNEQEFNSFGRDGWELTEYVPPSPVNNAHTFIFKRPILRVR